MANENRTFSLSLRGMELNQAIRIIAKLLHLNVVVSTTVKGQAHIDLIHANSIDVMNFFLQAHGLASKHKNNVWYIAPKNEIDSLNSTSHVKLKLKFWQIHYAKAQQISAVLHQEAANFLSAKGTMWVDNRTNTLCMRDEEAHLRDADSLIKRLDVPVRQLVISARLISIDHDMEKELGLAFLPQQSSHSSGEQQGSYSLIVAKLADRALLDVKLRALERTGAAELISSPRLFTADQQSASIEAGEEIPYQESSENGGTAVVFKKAVLSLHVTPQIMPGGLILLQLQINQDRPSQNMVLGMPTISTRQVKTSILVKNGHTIVLGGILENDQVRGMQQVPYLHRLPLLGYLFSQHKILKRKRELLIFVTPTVIARES